MDFSDCTVISLFDLAHTRMCAYLQAFRYPWEALPGLREAIARLGPTLGEMFRERAPQVWVHRDAFVAKSVELIGPCIVDEGCDLRHGAFIRGGVVLGRGCVAGNGTELKNSILFDGAKVPHLNYAGDSILGYRAHLGAGAVCSNFRADGGPVTVRTDTERAATGLKKCGAFLGDFAEVGCNAVLCPGTVVGRGTAVYPLTLLRGCYPPLGIVKHDGTIVRRR